MSSMKYLSKKSDDKTTNVFEILFFNFMFNMVKEKRHKVQTCFRNFVKTCRSKKENLEINSILNAEGGN